MPTSMQGLSNSQDREAGGSWNTPRDRKERRDEGRAEQSRAEQSRAKEGRVEERRYEKTTRGLHLREDKRYEDRKR